MRSLAFHIMGYRSCMKLQMGNKMKEADIFIVFSVNLYRCTVLRDIIALRLPTDALIY
jgi:hypothetical protein